MVGRRAVQQDRRDVVKPLFMAEDGLIHFWFSFTDGFGEVLGFFRRIRLADAGVMTSRERLDMDTLQDEVEVADLAVVNR